MHYYTTGNVLHDDPKTLNLDATYTYNNEGQMTSVKYPHTASYNGMAIVYTDGPTYTYSFDAMHRPTGLTDQNSNTIVNNVTYNAANQLLTFNNETRTYNNLNQMTRLQVTGNLDISYNFPAGTNNGKISTQTDNLSLETVTYQYDSLNRLVSATSAILERNLRIRRLRQSVVEDAHRRCADAVESSGRGEQSHSWAELR